MSDARIPGCPLINCRYYDDGKCNDDDRCSTPDEDNTYGYTGYINIDDEDWKAVNSALAAVKKLEAKDGE